MKKTAIVIMAVLVLLTGCTFGGKNLPKRTTLDQENIPHIITLNGNWRYVEDESRPDDYLYCYRSMKGLLVMQYMPFEDKYSSMKNVSNDDWDTIMKIVLPTIGLNNAEQKEDYYDLSNTYVIKRYYGDYTYSGQTMQIAMSAVIFEDGLLIFCCAPDITKEIYANEDTATIARGDFEFEPREE